MIAQLDPISLAGIIILGVGAIAYAVASYRKNSVQSALDAINAQAGELSAVKATNDRLQGELSNARAENAEMRGIVSQLRDENASLRSLIMGDTLPPALANAFDRLNQSVENVREAVARHD